jgi:hypothetical protein
LKKGGEGERGSVVEERRRGREDGGKESLSTN